LGRSGIRSTLKLTSPPITFCAALIRALDLSDLCHHLADFYTLIERPSIDPELMIRMLIV